MKAEITISVIIPCYNAENTILNCIKSILSQSQPVAEIIIVDDGSTDNSVNIITEFFKKLDVKYIVHQQKNSGPSIARNKGVALSSGSHIAFIDSDDEWLQDHILLIKEFLKNNIQYSIVSTKYFSAAVKYYGQISFEKLLFKNCLLTPCVVINKDCFFKSGGFNEKMKYCEDYFLWLDIAFKNKVYLLDYIGAKNVNDKRPFGDTGLSSNLALMHQGVLECYEEIYKKRRISKTKFFILNNIEKVKYLRRRIISAF
jgi:glycosyltransferase involved in cell wall biosynthesis